MGIIFTLMLPVMVFVLVAGAILRLKEMYRLRGCDHLWITHDLGNTISQSRDCSICEIRQKRLSSEYFWGAP